MNLSMGFQDMRGKIWDDLEASYIDDANKTFISTLSLNPSLIPKVGKAEAFYQQSNVPNPFEFIPTASTIWGYNVGIEVSSGVMLVYQVRTTYITNLDNPDKYDPVESVQIETQFIF